MREHVHRVSHTKTPQERNKSKNEFLENQSTENTRTVRKETVRTEMTMVMLTIWLSCLCFVVGGANVGVGATTPAVRFTINKPLLLGLECASCKSQSTDSVHHFDTDDIHLANTLTCSCPIRFFPTLPQLDGLFLCIDTGRCFIHVAATTTTTTNQRPLLILVSCPKGRRSGWTETKVLDDVDSTNHTCSSSSSAPWIGPMNMSCPSWFIQDKMLRNQFNAQACTTVC